MPLPLSKMANEAPCDLFFVSDRSDVRYLSPAATLNSLSLGFLTLPVQDEELLLRKVALVRLRAELARSEAEVAVLGQVTAHSLEARLLEERLLLLLVPYGILGKLVSVEVKSSAFTRLLSCSRRHD